MVLLLAVTAIGQGTETTGTVSQVQVQTMERNLVRAGMKAPDAAKMVQSMVTARFTYAQMTEVEEQMQLARREQLTLEAVRNKVYEGIAKHIAPDSIIQAANKVQERHAFAMQMAASVGRQKHSALGGIYAACLTSGLNREDAQRITAHLQTRSRQMNRERLQTLAVETMTTARDMVRLGVSSQVTASVINGALAHGYDQAAMRTMRHRFTEQQTATNREQLAQRYGQAIDRGARAEDLGGYGNAGYGGTGSGSGSGNGGSGGSGGSGGNGSGGSGGSGGDGGNGGGNGGGSGGGRN
jgi:hypothetical protein